VSKGTTLKILISTNQQYFVRQLYLGYFARHASVPSKVEYISMNTHKVVAADQTMRVRAQEAKMTPHPLHCRELHSVHPNSRTLLHFQHSTVVHNTLHMFLHSTVHNCTLTLLHSTTVLYSRLDLLLLMLALWGWLCRLHRCSTG
jgi:hypothetical protein